MGVHTDTLGPGWRTLAGIALALEAVALLVWLDAGRLPEPQTAGVGPAAAMHLVALFVAVLGVAHAVLAWGRRVRQVEEGAVDHNPGFTTNRAALAWVLGGLIALAITLQLGGGFVWGATALFVSTARAFGRPVNLRSLGLGAVLTTLVFVFFAKVLSLSLHMGPFERLLLA